MDFLIFPYKLDYFLFSFLLRKEIFPAISVNEDLQSSEITSLKYDLVSPEGAQEGEEYLLSINISQQTATTPYGEP